MTTHIPVCLKQVIEYLKVKPGHWYIDATFGGGGYSLAILNAGGYVIGIDWDKQAIIAGKKRLESACPSGVSYHLIHSNYANMLSIIKKYKISQVSGVVFDLGFSSDQLTGGRGFSFNQLEELLDLRYDQTAGRPAWQLIPSLTTEELSQTLMVYGQIGNSDLIAQALKAKAAETQLKVSHVVEIAKRFNPKSGRIHPATTLFQALRILVNRELDNLKAGLAAAESGLADGGRLVVVSFHSGEDRLVKQFFKQSQHLKLITKKAVKPSPDELKNNPKSRSAKLRVAEKINLNKK